MIEKKSGAMVVILLIASMLYGQEPVFRLRDLDNQWKEFEDVKGNELTVIDFWATWCQPCLRSIPLLNEMSGDFEDMGVKFVGVSVDGPRNQSKIKPLIHSLGIRYPILRDLNSELMSELGVTAVPTLLVYNNEGELIYFHEGFRPGDEEVIRKHLTDHLTD